MNRPRASISKRGRRRAAFTRTELLVVLAVVSVLGALVLAVLTTRRHTAQLTRCQSNLHEVGRAILLFGADHQDKLPGIDPALPGDLWWWYKEKVKGYAGLTGPSSAKDAVFACPLDRGYSDPKPFCQTARFDYGSYVFNGVNVLGTPNLAGWTIPSIHQPQKTLLAMEWSAHAPLSWHVSKTGKANSPFYSGARSVVGFVDGHVSFTGIYYDGYNAAYTRDPIPGYEYKFSGR